MSIVNRPYHIGVPPPSPPRPWDKSSSVRKVSIFSFPCKSRSYGQNKSGSSEQRPSSTWGRGLGWKKYLKYWAREWLPGTWIQQYCLYCIGGKSDSSTGREKNSSELENNSVAYIVNVFVFSRDFRIFLPHDWPMRCVLKRKEWHVERISRKALVFRLQRPKLVVFMSQKWRLCVMLTGVNEDLLKMRVIVT